MRGHPSAPLDLVVRCGTRQLIVVEVKKGNADTSDTIKHSGYEQWLAEQAFPHKYPVFLAVSAEEQAYEDFVLRSWGTVWFAMRRLAIDLRNEGRATMAAMILAFVAAVEQHLLGFAADVVRGVRSGGPTSFNPKVVEHMERFLEKGDEQVTKPTKADYDEPRRQLREEGALLPRRGHCADRVPERSSGEVSESDGEAHR